MAYVPGVKYDLFVSYAHADDAAARDADGWVSSFVDDLTRAVISRLGLATNQTLDIFFDRHSLRSNDDLEILKENARQSAVFVAVVSPSYVARDWTRDELDAFVADQRSAGRIFAIERLPAETYPDPLGALRRIAFWERSQHSKTERELTRNDNRWDGRIQDVAADIKDVLRCMRSAGGLGAPVNFKPAPPRASVDPGRTVLLAQVTDDLDEDREQVRRYLEQYGISVLPTSSLPQGAGDFTQAFEADLAQAGFFVQLLGPLRSRRQPDLPQGYARYQYDAAKREAAKRPDFLPLLWRRPDLEPASVMHEDGALLAAPETLAMGLEAFKAEIVRQVERVNTPKKPGPERKDQDIHVFINAARDDHELAKAVQKEFERNSCTALLPVYEGESGDIMENLAEMILWCDALALVYGEADPRWVSRQAMLYSKLKRKREEPARVVLICRAPPQPKREHGVSMPELREIDYDPHAAGNPISDVLAELRQ